MTINCAIIDEGIGIGYFILMRVVILVKYAFSIFYIYRIYTAKSRPSTPKRQRCLFSAISSSMPLLFMKSVTWFLHDSCGLPLLLLPCGVHWQIFFGQRLSSKVKEMRIETIMYISGRVLIKEKGPKQVSLY